MVDRVESGYQASETLLADSSLRFAAYDVLVPSGCATDLSATVEVTYYFFEVISSEAEKSAPFRGDSKSLSSAEVVLWNVILVYVFWVPKNYGSE